MEFGNDKEFDFLKTSVGHQMQFNVIVNRKGEKVLSILGFKESAADGLEGYGSEEDKSNKDDEETTLYVNLHKLFNQQKDQNPNEILNSSLINDERRLNDYVTSNPVTKMIEKFPNKLTPQLVQQVEMSEEIGSGAHARVHLAHYIMAPMALKVYDNSNPVALNAFNSELEAYCVRGDTQIMSHPSVVQLVGAY